MRFRNPIVAPEVPFGLAPEVLDPVDMCAALAHQPLAMVNPVMLEGLSTHPVAACLQIGSALRWRAALLAQSETALGSK